MRVLVALVLGTVAAGLLPSPAARAWWDGFGRWHPNYAGPRVYYAPPPPIYYARPYARWLPPHYNRFGRFIPGHWV